MPTPSEEDTKGAVPKDVLVRIGVHADDRSRIAAYTGANIPMRPLAALYKHLKSTTGTPGVEGGADYLSADALLGYRAKGKGPRFWFVSTPDAPGQVEAPAADATALSGGSRIQAPSILYD